MRQVWRNQDRDLVGSFQQSLTGSCTRRGAGCFRLQVTVETGQILQFVAVNWLQIRSEKYSHQNDAHKQLTDNDLFGGGGGIRTPGTLPGTVVFKTTAIDHSAIPPAFASVQHQLASAGELAFGHYAANLPKRIAMAVTKCSCWRRRLDYSGQNTRQSAHAFCSALSLVWRSQLAS